MHNRRHAPLHVKAKALLSTLSKSPSASKCLWSSLCSGTTFGTQASCNGRGIRACYLSAMLHTPFNDFAVIMNCLQGREVSTLNHLLIGQAGHLWIRNKESLGTFRTPEVLCSSTFFSQVLCHCLHSLLYRVLSVPPPEEGLMKSNNFNVSFIMIIVYLLNLSGNPPETCFTLSIIKNSSIHKVFKVY